MRSRLLALLLFCLGPAALLAQMPGGTYQQTCRDIHTDDYVLRAQCKDTNGNWHDTRLNDYDRCRGDISNQNGTLVCVQQQPGSWNNGGYQGSYTQTCRDIERHGNTLEATCQARDGSWHDTALRHANKCRGDIVNDNGDLRCSSNSGWQDNGGLPGGSYSQTCRNLKRDGDRLEGECRDRNGNWHHTELRGISTCQNNIENNDGHLGCRTSVTEWRGRVGGLPGGSYSKTCSDARMDGDTLKANCLSRDNHRHPTELRDTEGCADIANQDGHLTCIR